MPTPANRQARRVFARCAQKKSSAKDLSAGRVAAPGGSPYRENRIRGVCLRRYICSVTWTVELYETFAEELAEMVKSVRIAILAQAKVLEEYGPQLGRPYVDTLYGSTFTNMKELRCDAEKQVWRVAFAFDPERNAILLVGGDKRGKDQKRFYKKLVKVGDARFLDHLSNLNKED